MAQYFSFNNYFSVTFVGEQFIDTQENIDALHGETVTVITELPDRTGSYLYEANVPFQ